jgi:magnesium chelatase family protein
MMGEPGSGKSMLGQRFAGLLPPMRIDEALESAAIASLGGRFSTERWMHRPTASPHHTSSAVALVGGGSPPRPGEISMAHHGVLFLDEFPEFSRAALEALREPLETGTITIARAARRAEFPARFQLVAAMNPCPCGFLGAPTKACRCTPDQVVVSQGYCALVKVTAPNRSNFMRFLAPQLAGRLQARPFGHALRSQKEGQNGKRGNTWCSGLRRGQLQQHLL